MEKGKLSLKSFLKDERGLGTLEILLILAVLVAVAIVFRKWLIHWVNLLFEQSDSTINQSDQGELVEP